jgi:hypothetical protein
MNKLRRTFQAIIVAVVLCGPSVTSAATITYNNRASWIGAVAATNFTVDFESFATDTSFSTSALNVGPFTLSTVGTAAFGRNFVDVAPFLNPVPALPASFGNAAVDVFVQGSPALSVKVQFATPVRGFFADFFNPGNGTQLDMTLSFQGGGSADLLVPGTGSTLEPFGFTSTEPVASILLSNTNNDGLYLDNVSGAQQLAGVPEPASLTLFAIGLAGLVAARRRVSQNRS